MTIEKYHPLAEEVEKIEEVHHKPTKKREDIVNRVTSAKNFKNWMEKSIQLLHNDKNTEAEIIYQEILNKFLSFHPHKTINEIKIIDGWKGKDITEIWNGVYNNFFIKEHIKDKETGEIKETTKEILKEDINKMIFIINKFPLGEKLKCYEIAKLLGYSEWKSLWKERKHYFKFYYYPLKVLEALELIKYSGRGDITRII